VRFRDSHSGVPGKKSHLDVGPWRGARVYYKGEGVQNALLMLFEVTPTSIVSSVSKIEKHKSYFSSCIHEYQSIGDYQ